MRQPASPLGPRAHLGLLKNKHWQGSPLPPFQFLPAPSAESSDKQDLTLESVPLTSSRDPKPSSSLHPIFLLPFRTQRKRHVPTVSMSLASVLNTYPAPPCTRGPCQGQRSPAQGQTTPTDLRVPSVSARFTMDSRLAGLASPTNLPPRCATYPSCV